MSEQIREQVSAFLDGELPNSETELLLKRLMRDAELRDHFGRYALIGEAVRGTSRGALSKGFASNVNLAIDGEPAPVGAHPQPVRTAHWWKPIAGVAMAAGVAAVALVALQQRAIAPGLQLPALASMRSPHVTASQPSQSTLSGVAANGLLAAAQPATSQGHEALSYTVPATLSTAPAMLPPARLTNYIFAHSKYSSGLGRRGVLADLLIEDDDQPLQVRQPAEEPVTLTPVRSP
jgi:sigma-E factor negative regulatory protein RseA